MAAMNIAGKYACEITNTTYCQSTGMNVEMNYDVTSKLEMRRSLKTSSNSFLKEAI